MEPTLLTNGQGTSPISTGGAGVDPRLDAIKAKQSKGEKLDPKERGYLAYKNSLANGTNKPGVGRSPAAASVARQMVATQSPSNPLVTSGGAVETQMDGATARPVDPALVVKTIRTILSGVDSFTQRYIAGEAAKAGCDAGHQAEIVKAVALAPELRETISETSPDALAAMGVDTSQMPLMAFIGGLAVYGLAIGNAVASLKELQRQRLEADEARKKADAAPRSN